MSYVITSQCIGCSRCLPACPTGAIKQENTGFTIDAQLCNNCAGYYSVPQCMATCPTNGGCIPDVKEFWSHWFIKYNHLISRLHRPEQTQYWESWFDAYAQRVSTLIPDRPAEIVSFNL
jgi:ferredoxin